MLLASSCKPGFVDAGICPAYSLRHAQTPHASLAWLLYAGVGVWVALISDPTRRFREWVFVFMPQPTWWSARGRGKLPHRQNFILTRRNYEHCYLF